MLALHVSDTHLGAAPYGLVSRAKDVYEAFREVVEVALRERVRLVIHGGDFFDSTSPPPEAYTVAYRCLRRLKEVGIRIVAVAGQHDTPKRYSVSPLHVLQDLGVVDVVAVERVVSEKLSIEGVETTFYCVPYSCRGLASSITPSKGERALLIAHLLLKELGIPGERADASLNTLPGEAIYIALGDYHVRTTFRHRSGAYAVYPGATEVFRVNECCERYVALLDLSEELVRPQFVKLESTRPWVIVKFTGLQHFIKDVSERVERALREGRRKQPIVFVDGVRDAMEAVVRFLNDMVKRNAILYYRIRSEVAEEASPPTVVDVIEHVDVERMLKSMIGDEDFAKLITDYVKAPDKNLAEKVVLYIMSHPESVKVLEKAVGERRRSPSPSTNKGRLV